MLLIQALKTLANPTGFCDEIIAMAEATVAESKAAEPVVEEPVVEEPRDIDIPE